MNFYEYALMKTAAVAGVGGNAPLWNFNDASKVKPYYQGKQVDTSGKAWNADLSKLKDTAGGLGNWTGNVIRNSANAATQALSGKKEGLNINMDNGGVGVSYRWGF